VFRALDKGLALPIYYAQHYEKLLLKFNSIILNWDDEAPTPLTLGYPRDEEVVLH